MPTPVRLTNAARGSTTVTLKWPELAAGAVAGAIAATFIVRLRNQLVERWGLTDRSALLVNAAGVGLSIWALIWAWKNPKGRPYRSFATSATIMSAAPLLLEGVHQVMPQLSDSAPMASSPGTTGALWQPALPPGTTGALWQPSPSSPAALSDSGTMGYRRSARP